MVLTFRGQTAKASGMPTARAGRRSDTTAPRSICTFALSATRALETFDPSGRVYQASMVSPTLVSHAAESGNAAVTKRPSPGFLDV